MKDSVSENNEALLVTGAQADAQVGAAAGTDAASGDRPSLFCGLDGTCVNPHEAIPLNTRNTFARNFMSHFAAALGESQHAA
ncbi:MAG: hypothetical protein NVSMB69_04590 [Novosphingobium sp.]|jgi:hypothetical protein